MQIQIARTNGFIYYNQGDMNAAIDALETALRLSREISHHYWLLESAHWLALTYTKMGDLKRAAALCSDLETAYPRDFAPVAWVLAPHGIIATEWNQLGQAESLFTRSIEMARREQLMDALWISCVGLARVHLFRRELEPVGRLLDEGLQAAEAVGNKVVLSIARTVLARQALARGDLNQAHTWSENYLAQRLNEYPAELEDLTLTRVWVALGEDSRALDLLDQIIEHARLGGRNARLIEALA
jgi:tetratricopeptide (TPR) repeat protein